LLDKVGDIIKDPLDLTPSPAIADVGAMIAIGAGLAVGAAIFGAANGPSAFLETKLLV